ncbi:MAG: hypothetical protein NTV94_15065, partial [Planctomycetota bacterium]|nr:hypothetical protein [Planctomycetota bacterium]
GSAFSSQFVMSATDGTNNNSLGTSLSISGSQVLAGGPANDHSSLPNPGAVYAYSPFSDAGDTCQQAFAVGLGTVQGCTGGMNADGRSGCDLLVVSPDVYYSFTAPCTGTYNFNTAGSNYDTLLSLHSGCPATNANALACNDDSGATLQSSVTTVLAAGQAVRVRVADFSSAQQGVFELTISAAAPTNDTCAGAAEIVQEQTEFDLCFSNTEAAQPSGLVIVNDVWFTYTAGCSGLATFTTCPTTERIDTVLSVFETASCSGVVAANELGVNDDGVCGVASFRSLLQVQVVSGRTYYVRVGGYSAPRPTYTNRGHGILEVTIATGCPADFNQDGGIDGADVNTFFGAWEAGESSADVNCDGGVDGADIDVFFPAWEAGGC